MKKADETSNVTRTHEGPDADLGKVFSYNFKKTGLTVDDNMNKPTVAKVDIVKWIATVIQLIGYGLTGMNVVPWNIYAFIVGILLWFAVGVMWKDKAIMVVHVGAFLSLVIGYLYS